ASGAEGDVASLQDRAESAAGAAQQRLDACNHFDGGKRLDQIVVSPAVEPRHAILDGIAGGENENRYPIAGLPDRGQEVDAVLVRKAEIEDRRVIWRGGERRAGVRARR